MTIKNKPLWDANVAIVSNKKTILDNRSTIGSDTIPIAKVSLLEV